ncbi:hypothetical protein [Staphylococcus phage vB_SauM-T-SE-G1]|nr:hypothetical protein [Staphylococcus phage vB_SauM-V1SA15]
MPHLKAYDKEGNILAIGYNVIDDLGSVIIPNLAPHTHYPQGEFFVSWESESYESDKVAVPEFTTLESSYKEITFYFKDHLLVKAKSAYDLAVDNGFKGTEKEWVDSIKGEPGKDGKDLYLNNLTEEQLIELEDMLKGEKGDPFTFNDLTEEQIELLKGDAGSNGEDGENGINGLSAYELAIGNGFEGTLENFLTSLKGEALTFDDLTDEQKSELKSKVEDTGWILMSLQNGFFNVDETKSGLSYRVVTIDSTHFITISGKIKTPKALVRGRHYIGNIPISNPKSQAITAYASNYAINGTNNPVFSMFYENNVLTLSVVNDVPISTVFDIGSTVII